MKKFIIVDIETGGFDIESGIYELSALVIENMEIKDKLHIGIIDNESLINRGYGMGYEEISDNEECIYQFKEFINTYKYPIVAHHASFDRKFLVAYNWLDEDYEVFDSIRAIKCEMPYLFSYSLDYLLEYFKIEIQNRHTSTGDVEALFKILKIIKPKTWIQLGTKLKRHNNYKNKIEKIDIDKINIINNTFDGKNIVFTGKGPYSRKFLSVLAMKHSGKVLDRVNKNTDILVVGENAGSKLQKAKDLGIEILSIDDFMDLVQDTEMDYEFNSKDINKSKKVNTLNDPFECFIKSRYLENYTISLTPMRIKIAEKIGSIINAMGGEDIMTLRQKETDLLIYESYGEDFATVNRAKEKGIKTMRLSDFNRHLVNNTLDDVLNKNKNYEGTY